MKILEINKFNFPQGGADRHFLDVVDLLQQKNHQVAIFSMHHSQNLDTPWKKYFVSYVGYSPADKFWTKIKGIARMFYSFEAKIKIQKLLKDFQPDVVHIHNIYHQISPSILSEIKKRKIPIIMTVHDYKLICPNYLFRCQDKSWDEIGGNRFLFFIKNRCFKNSFLKSLLVYSEWSWHKLFRSYEKNVDIFISPSVFLKEKLTKNGIDGKKIVVLPHFHEAEIKKENERDFVFHFGRLSKDKGSQDIIDIFKDIPHAKLRLAGKMETELDWKEYDNIQYLGFLNESEIKDQIQKSLFVVSASRLPETFGLVALEAIANGKPFVALNKGAYSEIVENDQEGLLTKDLSELKNKIIFLLNNSQERKIMGEKALQKSKEFSRENYHERLMKIIDFLIKKC